MKKNILISLVLIITLSACSKRNPTPDGPTDIRIKNITASDFVNVVVNTGDETHVFGDVASSTQTEYFRFETAYPDSEITLQINGETYTTGVPDNTFAIFLQQGKFTYEVWISIPEQKKLDTRVIADAPLD
jgi:hypothetical protein